MVTVSAFIPDWATACLIWTTSCRGEIKFVLTSLLQSSIVLPTSNETPLMPALFVHKLSRVGRDDNLPDAHINCASQILCEFSQLGTHQQRTWHWSPGTWSTRMYICKKKVCFVWCLIFELRLWCNSCGEVRSGINSSGLLFCNHWANGNAKQSEM